MATPAGVFNNGYEVLLKEAFQADGFGDNLYMTLVNNDVGGALDQDADTIDELSEPLYGDENWDRLAIPRATGSRHSISHIQSPAPGYLLQAIRIIGWQFNNEEGLPGATHLVLVDSDESDANLIAYWQLSPVVPITRSYKGILYIPEVYVRWRLQT